MNTRPTLACFEQWYCGIHIDHWCSVCCKPSVSPLYRRAFSRRRYGKPNCRAVPEVSLYWSIRIPAWAIATTPTLLLALAGFGGFLDFMRTAGGGIAILIAVLFLPAYYRYRRTRSAPAILPRYMDKPWAGWVIAIAYILMAVGSAVSIR